MQDYTDHDATALAGLLAAGEVSGREVLDAAVNRLETVNPEINAVVTPMLEAAAAQVEQGLTGPLAGVPFLIKDLTMVADQPCSMGSAWRRP